MKSVLLALTLLLSAAPSLAQEPVVAEEAAPTLQVIDASAEGIDPAAYQWQWRIVAVLADSPLDPAFVRQMRAIEEAPNDLFERDVLVLFDADRNSGSALRRTLRPRGFMLAILGKDGEIKQRRPAPRTVREIGEIIDRFPLRRQELLERLPAGR